MCAAGCGNLIGLSDFSVAGGAGQSQAGSGNSAGSLADAGSTSDAGGSAGVGVAGAGTSGTTGLAGGAGASSACASDCDDGNDCTDDGCIAGECQHQPVGVGTACGIGRSCDAQAVCVRCRDTAAGTGRDAGCPAAAPVCLGSGTKAVCGGCMLAEDCDDGNECTSEVCTAGKCVFTPIDAGEACTGGVCNGSPDAEECVACADTAAGAAQDSGCSPAKPVCDSSATPTCYACQNNTDCASDNVSCTVETCTNHVCSHVATNSKCSSSGDVCKPNQCDAALDCKQVDISMSKPLVNAGSTMGNGSFEENTVSGATGWADVGTYTIVYNCTGSGCAASNGTTYTDPANGSFVAWLAGTTKASVTGTDHLLALPAGAVKLQILADINFQTKNSDASVNHDYFELRLLNAAKVQIGSALVAKSSANAQTGAARAWTADGINVAVDVSNYAGQDVYLSLWSSVDATLPTDFFIDDVRVTATVCQ